MKKIKTILFLTTLLFAFLVKAQETPKAVLSSADIDLFIKTLKPLQKDIEKLGKEYENINDPNALQALAAGEDVKAIFKKYGWSDDYFLKVSAITNAYAYLKMEKEYDNLPEEQKVYMKQMMEQYKVGNKDLVNDVDLKLIDSKFDLLDTFFLEYKD